MRIEDMKKAVSWEHVFIAAMVSVAFLMTSKLFEPDFVVVDMTRAIQAPAQQIAKTKLSAARQANLMAQFTKMLPIVIDDYAKRHHVMVVSGRVLSHSNSLDVTQQVIEQTIKRLKQHD